MMFYLSKRSKARLVGVHPDLVEVVEAAIQITAVDFSVVEGVRTLAKQREYFTKGKSRTMRSRHLPESNVCRMGCAVDLAPWVDGTISWEERYFFPVARAMKVAAASAAVPLEWGFDLWKWDMPHFQLPWRDYP